MYLIVESFIEINNIITGSNNVTLRKVNARAHGFDKMYMDTELIEDKLYQMIDQFSQRNITSATFCVILLNKTHQFYDGNDKLYIKQCCLIVWSVGKIQTVKMQNL